MERSKQQTQGLIYPKEFFENNKSSIVKNSCFVMMPFETSLQEVYKAIESTMAELGYKATRADQVFDTKPIMISIMEKINESEMIVADVTGRNANVFYELGMAHMVKERVILITQSIDDVPFDLQHFRHIIYQATPEGIAKLRQSLMDTIRAIGLAREPMAILASEEKSKAPSEQAITKPLSTTIFYSGSFEETKGSMFAVLSQWLEYDQVEERFNALAFQGGTFQMGGLLELTLQPGKIPLAELISGFGHSYKAINYKLEKPLDIGDIVKRSRDQSRKLKSLEKDHIIFLVDIKFSIFEPELSVQNTGEGASLTIFAPDGYEFRPNKSPIPPSAPLCYLLNDPPGNDLVEAIRESLGIRQQKSN